MSAIALACAAGVYAIVGVFTPAPRPRFRALLLTNLAVAVPLALALQFLLAMPEHW